MWHTEKSLPPAYGRILKIHLHYGCYIGWAEGVHIEDCAATGAIVEDVFWIPFLVHFDFFSGEYNFSLTWVTATWTIWWRAFHGGLLWMRVSYFWLLAIRCIFKVQLMISICEYVWEENIMKEKTQVLDLKFYSECYIMSLPSLINLHCPIIDEYQRGSLFLNWMKLYGSMNIMD